MNLPCPNYSHISYLGSGVSITTLRIKRKSGTPNLGATQPPNTENPILTALVVLPTRIFFKRQTRSAFVSAASTEIVQTRVTKVPAVPW